MSRDGVGLLELNSGHKRKPNTESEPTEHTYLYDGSLNGQM